MQLNSANKSSAAQGRFKLALKIRFSALWRKGGADTAKLTPGRAQGAAIRCNRSNFACVFGSTCAG